MKQVILNLRILAVILAMSAIELSAQTWVSMNGPYRSDTRDLAAGTNSGVTRLYAADAGGLYYSENGASSWQKIETFPTTPQRVACKLGSALNLIVAADNNSLYKSTDGVNFILYGTSIVFPFRLSISSANEQIVWLGLANSGTTSSLWKTIDFGDSWTPIEYFNSTVETHVRDVLPDPTNDSTAWVCGIRDPGALGEEPELGQPYPNDIGAADFHSGVWKTTDGGASWTQKNSGLTKTHITALGRKYDAGTSTTYIFAGADSRMFRSSDGGDSWSEVASFAFSTADTIRAIVSRSDNNDVFAVADNGLWVSHDNGANWSYTNGNFPYSSFMYDPSMRDIVIDPNSQSTIYTSAKNSILIYNNEQITSRKKR
jgi:hypothetical protein